ncbi:hypothetical protein CEXT_14341 [Caerostris extrusa]|uniref:Geminin n=2 Tax=Caerostris TaxID=172845 RepID=A0AAV4PBI0_CAEEX|nr:hypothetical protein CEXT_14341 [Caerostris extrusa]
MTVPKVTSKSKKVSSKKKIKTDLNNSKTDSLIPSLPDIFGTPTENKEMETTVLPYRSVSEIENMLTADIPPESYWKELAEQRRISLEQTLRENADLADQLEVLEAENSHLKSCLKEAEKLAETLNAILD